MDKSITKQTTDAVIFFTTKLFDYEIPHGLSYSMPVLNAVGLDRLSERFSLCYQPKQIHSKNIVTITGKEKEIYEADGLITNTPGLLLSIRTADCVPILMFDKNNRVVAAVHSGWRGTSKQIAHLCAKKLIDEFAADPKKLMVYIGPSIRDCCYEVSEKIAKQFSSYNQPSKIKNGKPFIDLAYVNKEMLINTGVPEGNICIEKWCTGCEAQLFYSWRKRKDSGRMYAVIGIPEIRKTE